MDASQVLSRYWSNKSYPVDPYIIAYENNIEIRLNPKLDKEILGKIFVTEDNDNVIEINPWHTPYRQRFTVAHELGHFFLNHGINDVLHSKIIYDTLDGLSNPTDTKEIEANEFAGNLLMPKEFIEYILYKLQISDIAKMAKMLDVSKSALTFHLEKLGII